MKTVLFCGGFGTRIQEYQQDCPKPMVPIGNQPILWHIMKYYSDSGFNEFILCLGYLGSVIKNYFLNRERYFESDCVIERGQVKLIDPDIPDWRITLMDTGMHRNIGGRLWAVRDHVLHDDVFLANYSDGLTDANLRALLDQFRESGKVAGFLAVRPPVSYHQVEVDDTGTVQSLKAFQELNLWINGGYFMLRPKIFDYMSSTDDLVDAPFQRLIKDDQLIAFKHDGFWRSMDTLRDRTLLEDILRRGSPPWRLAPLKAAGNPAE